MVMKIAHADTLLLQAVLGAASLAMLWLSFWLRDRRRRHHELQLGRANHQPRSDLARAQQDGAMLGRLAIASVAYGLRLTINVDSSNVQPASEKDKAILHGPEHAQHFDDKPQIQAEQH